MKIFAPIGYDNVHTRVGDGYYGWPEVEGGFDIIIFTCAAQYAPPELFKQLKPGGRMIIPIGQPFKRGQVLFVYTKDEDGKMNRSITDISGAALVVSQFTLHASTKKGNRPSFIKAARPETAIPLYEEFIKAAGRETGRACASGEFGADMQVSLVNDGPVTIMLDTELRE